MKKITIRNTISNEITHCATFDTQEQADEWINKQIAKNNFGKPERVLLDTNTTPVSQELKDRASLVKEVELEAAIIRPLYEYEEIETVDENGDSVTTLQLKLDENGDRIVVGEEELSPAVMGTEYTIPCEYTITEEDSDNGYFDLQNAYDDLRKERDEILSSLDFTQLPDAPVSSELRVKYKDYRVYLRDLTTNYNDSNITTYSIMTFNEWLLVNP